MADKEPIQPDDGVIPLADETFYCDACGDPFVPRSGEATCQRCTHVVSASRPLEPLREQLADTRCVHCGYELRGLPSGTRCPECGQGGPVVAPPVHSTLPPAPLQGTRRREVPPADDLLHRGAVATAALQLTTLVALAAALAGGGVAAAHWWRPSLLGPWAAASSWAAFTLCAALLTSPACGPLGRHRGWILGGSIGCGALAILLMATYALTGTFGGVAFDALLDLLMIGSAVTFLFALGTRISGITEFTGQDPEARSYLSASGPFLLGIFIISMGTLLTWFFRRKLDFADAFSLAVSAWLVWRLTAILLHARSASVTRRDQVARDERRRERRAAGGDLAASCAACGHSLSGLSLRARCPECGSTARN